MSEHDLKVFISGRESTCDECGEMLGRSAWICLLGDVHHMPPARPAAGYLVVRGVRLRVENLWTGRRIGGAKIERCGEAVLARA
jgi:hypothetical protein